MPDRPKFLAALCLAASSLASAAILAGSVLLSACTTQQASLKSAMSFNTKTPTAPFTFDSVAGLAKVRSTMVLAPGPYEPVGQDDEGVWYLGKMDTLFIIYVDSPKNRIDGKLATAVYQGGVFVPHQPTQAARIFYVPISEKFRISDAVGMEGVLSTQSDYISDVVLQNTLNSTLSPLQAGAAGAIAGAIVFHDASGFKIYPILPPADRDLRDWLVR